MNKWIYLFILALLALLIGLWSNTWMVGEANQTKDSQIQKTQEELDEKNQELKEKEEKIKQLNKRLESKLLKQRLASKAPPQASTIPSTRLISVPSVKYSCE